MVFQSVRLLIQYNLSRSWDLSALLIHAFADGDGNPSMTSVDPEGNAFTSSVSLNLGPCMSRRKKVHHLEVHLSLMCLETCHSEW